ncbi:cytidylate kinase [Heliomicrobium modesticaldum Ice1]|uniref:Cytidylate kinase n=1 Tax=Heliobacterium modesticaldum (strain ATCC 51547 / Ice1) TaxID=498761 RepID=B0TFQ6_HELMI|nr:(d)CMP kinase [Heliomicrobium modesticaldum]ABZ84486.1 cytidylate kinase [Heliomicrobium modesticaldum Ice1]
MTRAGIQVAIDGPAGAGKSTVARELAKRLGYLYIDTGAMYRALTWLALQKGIALSDDEALARLAEQADIALLPLPGGLTVLADGQDVTDAIRTPEVSRHVSRVSAVAGVRAPMMRLQQKLAEQGGVVMDGRDIGTHVLPQAEVKVFLTASVEERARRRFKEMILKGMDVDFEQLRNDMERRDREDFTRETAPLVQADDALYLDTTGLAFEEVVGRLLDMVHSRTGDGR